MLSIVVACLFSGNLPPAFLDDYDRVRVWLPHAVDPQSIRSTAHFTINGKSVEIRGVEGAPPLGQSENYRKGMVVIAGSFQHLLGGSDWQPGSTSSEMKQVAPEIFQLDVRLTAGRYEYKVARGGTWKENYGAGFAASGPNLMLIVPGSGANIRFVVDFQRRLILDSINNPEAVPTPRVVPPIETIVRSSQTNVLDLRLAHPIQPTQLAENFKLDIDNEGPRQVFPRGVLDHEELQPNGLELGTSYQPGKTVFHAWCPTASDAMVDLNGRYLRMIKGMNGTFTRTVSGDYLGQRYRLRFISSSSDRETVDIWSKAATEDGSWSIVANPENRPVAPLPPAPPTTLPIYELSVRDFTIDHTSKVSASLRGKFAGSVAPTPDRTGLNYLKWLGVGAVQLMPIQMFNPDHRNDYNWGYETFLFNVPESQYSADASKPLLAIQEVKAMVSQFHQSGIRLIMDVVYNHSVPSEGKSSPFWQTIPYYFFRTDDQGQVLNESGVGNALDDDRPFVRRYIRDSLVFWAKNYGVDGFRFDLMGMFQKESLKDWRAALNRLRPGIVMYGEPWTGGGPLRFGKGDQKDLGIGVFNDHFREAIRGDLDGDAKGYAMGNRSRANSVALGLAGSTEDFTSNPAESVNYVSAHDNLTLWDKIGRSMPEASDSSRRAALVQAGELILCAQGIPFLEGGAELGRTKNGNRNSYNAGDSANRFDWNRAKEFMGVAERYRKLISWRKRNAAFFSAPLTAVKTKVLPDQSIEVDIVASSKHLKFIVPSVDSANRTIHAGG